MNTDSIPPDESLYQGMGFDFAAMVKWKDDPRTKVLARLLIEARDALPAISRASAKLHGVDLSLGDRIERALQPWRTDE